MSGSLVQAKISRNDEYTYSSIKLTRDVDGRFVLLASINDEPDDLRVFVQLGGKTVLFSSGQIGMLCRCDCLLSEVLYV